MENLRDVFTQKRKTYTILFFKSLVNVCLHRNKNICLRSLNPNQFFSVYVITFSFPLFKTKQNKKSHEYKEDRN